MQFSIWRKALVPVFLCCHTMHIHSSKRHTAWYRTVMISCSLIELMEHKKTDIWFSLISYSKPVLRIAFPLTEIVSTFVWYYNAYFFTVCIVETPWKNWMQSQCLSFSHQTNCCLKTTDYKKLKRYVLRWWNQTLKNYRLSLELKFIGLTSENSSYCVLIRYRLEATT